MGLQVWQIWFILGAFFLILEIFTPAFFSALVGVACFVAGVLAIFIPEPNTLNLILELILFAVSLVLLLIFIRPWFLDMFRKDADSKESNANALIGRDALVDTEINNLQSVGYVKIGGEYWKARSADGDVIEKGKVVTVQSIEGITVIVSPKK